MESVIPRLTHQTQQGMLRILNDHVTGSRALGMSYSQHYEALIQSLAAETA